MIDLPSSTVTFTSENLKEHHKHSKSTQETFIKSITRTMTIPIYIKSAVRIWRSLALEKKQNYESKIWICVHAMRIWQKKITYVHFQMKQSHTHKYSQSGRISNASIRNHQSPPISSADIEQMSGLRLVESYIVSFS